MSDTDDVLWKPWNQRRPFDIPWVWALFVVVMGVLSPCNSGPAVLGYLYGWRWGVVALLISWGAVALFNYLFVWRHRKRAPNVS